MNSMGLFDSVFLSAAPEYLEQTFALVRCDGQLWKLLWFVVCFCCFHVIVIDRFVSCGLQLGALLAPNISAMSRFGRPFLTIIGAAECSLAD
jgi:hypothetical protein